MVPRQIVSGIATAVCASVVCFAAPTATPRETKVEEIAAAHHVTDETPGFAFAVIEHGKIMQRHGFGLANVENKRPIRAETTFELASLSKTFTSTAVCLLHDRGKLNFDEEVRKYLPELPEPADKKHTILISHLLHHTSGLPDYTGFEPPKPAHPGYVTNEDFARLFATKPRILTQRFAPGEKYEYCNTNYLLLALIVERVSKRPFSQFMHEAIFKPLGMEHTWINDRPDAPPKEAGRVTPHATGYAKKKTGGWKATWGAPPVEDGALLTTGDGAVWSSVDDLALFDAGLHEGKLLKRATWKQALTPSKTRDGKTNAYGFGWVLELDDKEHVTSYGHEGAWGGFHTAYYRYTGTDRAVIVLSNRDDFKVGDVWEAIDALFEPGAGKRKGANGK